MAALELHPGRNGYVLRKINPDGSANELWLTSDDLLSSITFSRSVGPAGPRVYNRME